MNVTFLTGEYPPMQGGIADYTDRLIAYLAPLGISASVLTSRRWQEIAQRSGVYYRASVHPIVPNWGWQSWPTITRYLQQYQPQVLHIQYQAAAFDLGGWINWLPWYLKRRGIPTKVVTTFHDLRIPYLFPKAGWLRWQAILALARHSDVVISTNQADPHILRQHKISTPIHVIPLGNNITPNPPPDYDRTRWRQGYEADEQTIVLAFFGFLTESKGGEELIESVAQLRGQGRDVRLVFIGSQIGDADSTNAHYNQLIRALIVRHQLEPFIHFTGRVEETVVSAHLLAADAVVLPYRDGVSFRRTTLIAALRHGCPTISTWPDAPQFVPEINTGENMLLARPHNATSLAATIDLLITRPHLRDKLRAGALDLGQKFDWPTIAQQTVERWNG